METPDRSYAYQQALIAMDRIRARDTLSPASADADAHAAIERIVVPALERIGDDWEHGLISLAQLYMAGRIAEETVSDMLPRTRPAGRTTPRAAIAVLEDHHSLGKRLVLSALRASGHDVLDYGHGVTVDELVQRAHDDDIQVLLVSTLMLPAALRVREVVSTLASSGRHTAVIVGGAPFRLDPPLWREVGADATGRNSAEAMALLDSFLGGAS
jgi:methylmalonyl-CoA mutase cobalamin-binding domain/chain